MVNEKKSSNEKILVFPILLLQIFIFRGRVDLVNDKARWDLQVRNEYLRHIFNIFRVTFEKYLKNTPFSWCCFSTCFLRCFLNVTRKILKIWRRYSLRTCRSHRALSFTRSTRPLKMNILSSKIGKTKIFSFEDFFSFTIILCYR